MYKIVFICTGNTCRSPMAEGILRVLLADEGIDNVQIGSAGIGTMDGYPATIFAKEVAQQRGIDISEHHSTRMTEEIATDADLLLALAENHYQILAAYSGSAGKLFMLKGFPKEGLADQAHSIKDPIGGTFEEYTTVYQEIEAEIKRIYPEIVRRIRHQQKNS